VARVIYADAQPTMVPYWNTFSFRCNLFVGAILELGFEVINLVPSLRKHPPVVDFMGTEAGEPALLILLLLFAFLLDVRDALVP
jgi:hypothetical protein